MKNKEIENILDKCAPYLFGDELDKLLSYIEGLENNRDKALKKLNKYRNRKDHYGLWCMEYIDNADIIHTLKGDSDD